MNSLRFFSIVFIRKLATLLFKSFGDISIFHFLTVYWFRQVAYFFSFVQIKVFVNHIVQWKSTKLI